MPFTPSGPEGMRRIKLRQGRARGSTRPVAFPAAWTSRMLGDVRDGRNTGNRGGEEGGGFIPPGVPLFGDFEGTRYNFDDYMGYAPQEGGQRDREGEYEARITTGAQEMDELLPTFAKVYAFGKAPDRCVCSVAQYNVVKIYCIGWKESQEKTFKVCGCPGALSCLILEGYFPIAASGCRTAFSLDLMEFFRAVFHTGNTSKDGFANGLAAFNRSKLGHEVGEYKEHFRHCLYFFFRTAYLAGVVRGNALAATKPESAACVTFGSLAERCPADFYRKHCKEPESPWILSIDACFQHWRWLHASKYSIPAYNSPLFVHVPKTDRASIQATAATPNPTALCAHNFKAAGAKPTTMKKCDETGLVAVVCRHDCCVSLMNIYSGERFDWVIYCIEKTIEKMKDETGLDNDLLLLYDVACRLETFVKSHRPVLAKRMTAAVNKFHCFAHEVRCQKLYGVVTKKGAGESDGEGTERIWAFINGLVAAGREASASNRMLILDDRILFCTTRKRYAIAGIIRLRFLKATKNHIENTKRLAELAKTPVTIIRAIEGTPETITITDEFLLSEFGKQQEYFQQTSTRRVTAILKIYDSLILENDLKKELEEADLEEIPAAELLYHGQVKKTDDLLRHHKHTREDWAEGSERWKAATRRRHPSRKSFLLISAELKFMKNRSSMDRNKYLKRMNALRNATDKHLQKAGESRTEWKKGSAKWKRYENEDLVLSLEAIYQDTLKSAAARAIELRNLKARSRGNKAAKKILASIMKRFPIIEKKIDEFNNIAAKLPPDMRPPPLTKAAFIPDVTELDAAPSEDGLEALWKLEMIRSTLFEPELTIPNAYWPYAAQIRFGIDCMHRRDRAEEELALLKLEWSRVVSFTVDRISIILDVLDNPTPEFSNDSGLVSFLWEEVQGLKCMEAASKRFDDAYFLCPEISILLQRARAKTDLRNVTPPHPPTQNPGNPPAGGDGGDGGGNQATTRYPGDYEDDEAMIKEALFGGDRFDEDEYEDETIADALNLWARHGEIKDEEEDDYYGSDFELDL